MPDLPAAFTEEHLSLLPQQTLHRLHNLAATLCAALDDEQSRRNAHPRLPEEVLSPHSRALLSVGSRQLLQQALLEDNICGFLGLFGVELLSPHDKVESELSFCFYVIGV
jgi:hypothetical protein